MKCGPINVAIRKKNDRTVVNEAMKTRGRPKQTRMEIIKKDMLILYVSEDIALDTREWKKGIHVGDHKILG